MLGGVVGCKKIPVWMWREGGREGVVIYATGEKRERTRESVGFASRRENYITEDRWGRNCGGSGKREKAEEDQGTDYPLRANKNKAGNFPSPPDENVFPARRNAKSLIACFAYSRSLFACVVMYVHV